MAVALSKSEAAVNCCKLATVLLAHSYGEPKGSRAAPKIDITGDRTFVALNGVVAATV